MQQDYNDINLMFSNWENENASRGQRKEYLSQMGYSDVDSESILDKYNQYRVKKRLNWGWFLMGFGGFLGFLSCVLTMMEILPSLRGFVLYGLTSIAILLALAGCYLVMEKGREDE
ncbi:MAG: hypothetical protein K1X49_00150 [Saprospiraceae bacterium]|jgi:hypothetical protein|nr:hypothetical protein [Saprospiraceae bacterium]